MPGKIKVKVLAGRNLPVMDRASDTTDAFVEIKFGSVTHKTDVCRKTLNPHWNSTEWYRFEVDESELQDEPLQLRLMDHDTYSANDAIGKVVISLAPLLAREANNAKGAGPPGAVLSGWIPVFDTMHGIRGELHVIVKVELFSDFNKYKTSSCGVQFFHCSSIPPGYRATAIHGFVEELVVNDDPEYQWIDKIRTPRASNEARQVAFIQLSNQVQRLVGLKAAELGANAVVGYQQDFDLEGEAGVVARAIGTAVSLIPPVLPNQSISLPPCTQQQLKKYLDILATDNESIVDLNQYFQSHRDELQKLLNIMHPKTPPLLDDPDNMEDDEKKYFTRQSSIKSYTGWYQGDYVSQKSLKHISDDQTGLNKLLRRNDDSDSDSTGALQKIKKIKSNFTKRLGSLRSRKSDKLDDTVSLKSNSSDNSRISLTDIRNEFKKLKRLKKPKFRKTFTNIEDEGIGMASILARSVIHAHTSLACIAEKDSEHSPSSTMRRTSESEPTMNVSDDERKPNKIDETNSQSETKPKVSETHTSFKNIIIDNADIITRPRNISESCPSTPVIGRSDNLLKLPNETGYFGSVSLSGDSSEAYTSSEEDDDSFDRNADLEKSVETTSSVVQSVLNKDVNPVLIAQMERKLSILEGVIPELNESKSHVVFAHFRDLEAKDIIETSKSSPCIHENVGNKKGELEQPATSSKDVTSATVKCSNYHHFKFHNPFVHKKVTKSMSAPSSPVEITSFMYRSSKKIKRQLSKISNSNMFKSFSHYSLANKKKNEPMKVPISQPESTLDVLSKVPSHETVLGSPFLSYVDLMSLDRDEPDLCDKSIYTSNDAGNSKVKMYIGSEPVSRASLSGSSSLYYKDDGYNHDQKSRKEKQFKGPGLVHTAMETILIDKIQSLLLPASPEPSNLKEKQFFDDVNKKLGKVEEARNQLQRIEFGKKPEFMKSGSNVSLTVQSNMSNKHLSPSATPAVIHGTDNTFFKSYSNNNVCSNSKEQKENNDSLIRTAMKTILIDKVQSLIPVSSEPVIIVDDDNSNKSKQTHETLYNKHHDIKHSLIHTAMETILIDKVQALLPPSTEPVDTDDELIDVNHQQTEKNKENYARSNSLFHTALETILLDKAQLMIPSDSEPVTPDCLPENSIVSHISQIPDKVDEVKDSCKSNQRNSTLKVHRETDKVEDGHSSLLHSAMETILMDKVQVLIPSKSECIILEATENNSNYSDLLKTPEIVQEKKSNRSLFHSAIETLLIDKQQVSTDSAPVAVEDASRRCVVTNIPQIEEVIENAENSDNELCLRAAISEIISSENNVKTKSILQSTQEIVKIINYESSYADASSEDKSQTLTPISAQHIYDSIDDGEDKTPKIIENTFEDDSNSTHPMKEMDPIDKIQLILPSLSNKTVNTIEINTTSQAETKEEVKLLSSHDIKEKNLLPQVSVHSLQEDNVESQKMFKETNSNNSVPSKVTHSKSVLQHFHPILSGKPLETIPSLPESSFDHTESLDIDGGVENKCDCQSECLCKECDSGTNSASVCDNSHAACDVDRNEREKDKVFEKEKGSPRHARHESYGGREPVGMSTQNSSFTSSTPMGMHRRSSDSDLSVTPKGGSLNASLGNTGNGGGAILRPSMNSSNIEMLEYPFLTMKEYPPGLIVHIGGTVCARSVKLVDAGGESAARAAWWAELRTELRAHARALRCNAVIAYTESAAICEDVCVLSASGTAAVINLDCDFGNELDAASALATSGYKADDVSDSEECTLAHVPYSPGMGPYRAELSTCGGCKKARVPAVLLATCAKPTRLPAYAKAVTLTAVAARTRRAAPASEPGARDISDQLPFLEYELHKLLLAKLRMQGANALFSLQTQIAIGERCVMALASGTAVRLVSLPPPTPPRIKATENDRDALDIQRALWDSFTANKAANGYDIGGSAEAIVPNIALPELEIEEASVAPVLDLCADKDACVLELDEAEDVETAKTLAARRTHMQVFTNTMKPAKGAPPQMFAQVWRARLALSPQGAAGAAERHLARALDGVAYKLRRLQPCALVAPHFQLELPEDEIQLIVSGSAISLDDPTKPEPMVQETTYSCNSNNGSPLQHSHSSHYSSGNNDISDNEDDIFTLDEEQSEKSPPPSIENNEDKSLILNGQMPTTVTLTTLGFVSGSRVERRVCALRLLFVRETTAVRELGGLSGFLHTFTCEVLAIARAYTAALGGNALTSFYITQLMLQDNAHKNQLLPDYGEAKGVMFSACLNQCIYVLVFIRPALGPISDSRWGIIGFISLGVTWI